MRVTGRTLALAAFCVVVWQQAGLAQVASATILEIDLENRVNYAADVADISKFATDPNMTTAVASKNFRTFLQMGDIVAVNGKPARGTQVLRGQTINISKAPVSGQAVADTSEQLSSDSTYQILQMDGTPIGSLMVNGLGGGDTPPGAASGSLQGDSVIVGGTGAFLGVRGQQSVGVIRTATRNASVTEDPAVRRRIGGGAARVIFTLIPMTRPEIKAVFHSDFSPVTAATPAKVGEVLITMATGLGPTRPGLNPGQPFPPYPANPLQLINSPVEVIVNAQSVGTINAIGWPTLVDTYRVDFQVPNGTAAGMAAIQLTAAWITGPSVNIPIQ